jgi:hypothetical protein
LEAGTAEGESLQAWRCGKYGLLVAACRLCTAVVQVAAEVAVAEAVPEVQMGIAGEATGSDERQR